ncbi:ribosome biogenesis GTP-binding protein YihA/YsxC [Parafilimonas terrae]|uniref:Probable GTP-binding protein EngB n=1 Tax=Parafilimonas terrae TaxID=1465490 RepID=A0A1I5ZEG8_9BACT|nr:ribosome biogenesis GTP-binding protein YihA/YsxC [Parafilimonas terrae]SFQ54527.1 GTP-binding protein [Parafilimonas terrae]
MQMQITKAAYLISSPSVDKCPQPDRPEYAFIGRSNVGKSSLINMLCNNAKLAKTSAAPGKTQLINHYEIESVAANQKARTKWFLVDLPGYGYAKRAQKLRKQWTKMIEDYLRKRKNLLNIFVLIDARHKPQKIDLEFIDSLGEWQLPFTIVFTKADKEKPGAVERNVKLFFEKMKENWEFLPPYFVTSAVSKSGKDDVLKFIEDCNLDYAASNARAE